MVHVTRLELARVAPYAPQAYVSADSTTGAAIAYSNTQEKFVNISVSQERPTKSDFPTGRQVVFYQSGHYNKHVSLIER